MELFYIALRTNREFLGRDEGKRRNFIAKGMKTSSSLNMLRSLSERLTLYGITLRSPGQLLASRQLTRQEVFGF